MNSFQRLSLIIALCLLPVLAPAHSVGQEAKLVISTEEETAQEIAATPCKDGERLKAVRALFVKNGANNEDVLIEKLDGVENLVIRKQGKSQETIIVGAHYDKTIDGCGAVDNWTGIVALAHIYRSLKNVSLQKSVIFVAFGKEEQGLLGSKAMARSIKKEELARYCAMVNIDSLGMASPQVAVNLSSKSLIATVADLAGRMNLPFNMVTLPGAGADSLSFMDKKIPAVTISALGNNWGEVLHTLNDRPSKVNPTSLYLGYRLALALVTELSNLPCDANRE